MTQQRGTWTYYCPQLRDSWKNQAKASQTFGGAMNRFVGNTNSYNNFFEYASPAVAPQGEARPEEWVWLMLAKRFGVDSSYNPALAPVFTEDQWDWTTWNTAVEAAHQKAYQTWAQDPKVSPLNPPAWADFKKKPVWRYDAIEVGPYANWLGNNENPFANTNSKAIRTIVTSAFESVGCSFHLCAHLNVSPYVRAAVRRIAQAKWGNGSGKSLKKPLRRRGISRRRLIAPF